MDPVTDKSWMYIINRTDPVFRRGLEKFLEFATTNIKNLTPGRIPCPCKKCGNTPLLKTEDVRIHLVLNGFMPRYIIWTRHGEYPPGMPSSRSEIPESVGTGHLPSKQGQSSFRKLHHHTGSKSFAKVSQEMAEEHGEMPGPLDLYDKVYGPRSDLSAKADSSLDQMKSYVASQLFQESVSRTGPQDKAQVQHEAFTQVLGQDKADRVRGAGTGATPRGSAGGGRNKMLNYLQQENTTLKEKVKSVEEEKARMAQEQERMAKEMAVVKEQHTQLMNFLIGIARHTGFPVPSFHNIPDDQGSSTSDPEHGIDGSNHSG